VNLGVGVAPARGLQWVFEQFEEAIVLEDDCVPHPTFFRYCGELLAAYRHDERVMHISGDNWNFAAAGSPASYFFSAYCYSCGWATWRRAFRRYDPGLALWPALRETGWMLDVLGDAEAVEFWRDKFDRVHAHGVAVHGWDWPWLFACWAHRGLSILPRTNLITNVGFGADATHTRRRDDPRAFVPALPMSFPLRHPLVMARDLEADRSIADQVGVPREKQDLYHRLRRACVDALPAPLRRSLASARARLVPAHPPRA
jgi:hypothetical protein